MNDRPVRSHRAAWVCLLAGALLCISSSAAAFDGLDAHQLQEAIASFSHEPDVYEVQRKVLEHRDLDGDRPDRWTRRARLSNLLPSLQAQTNWLDQRDRQDQFRENIDADDFGAYEPNNAQHLWRDNLRFRSIYSLRISVDLSEVVYSRHEMAIQREVRSRWAMHDDLVDQVTALYFERRRQQLHLQLIVDDDPESLLERHLQIEAMTARIDALTGGWFRHQIKEEP